MEKARAEDVNILKMYCRYVDDEALVAESIPKSSEDDTRKDDERTSKLIVDPQGKEGKKVREQKTKGNKENKSQSVSQ